MKFRRSAVLIIVALSALLAAACNLLDLMQMPSGNEDAITDVIPEEPSDEEVISAPPTVAPTDTPEPTEEPQTEAWIVAVTDTSILYLKEGDSAVQTATQDGYIVSAVPAPSGGKIAVMRSETEGHSGKLWLDLFDLPTRQWIPVTILTNDDTALTNWEDSIGMEAREANIATTYSPPVWTPDGSAVIFISAHEGKFAKPFTYHIDTGNLHDVSLGGDTHWYDPTMSPDGQFIVVPSAFQFGTGAGYAMDSLAAARVDGGEVTLLMDVSHSIDEQTWGWLDNNTVVISDVSIMAGPIKLRTLDIHTGEEHIIVKDFFTNAAVAEGAGTVMFTSVMGELLDYTEPQQISESGLYHWDRSTLTLQKLNDFAEYSSFVDWNVTTQCYYADLPRRFVENEDEVWAFTAAGGMSDACVAINTLAQATPEVSASGRYYAFANMFFQSPERNAFYVQDFSQTTETKLADGSVFFFTWHPDNDILLFFQAGRISTAAAPDFLVQEVIPNGDAVQSVFWVSH